MALPLAAILNFCLIMKYVSDDLIANIVSASTYNVSKNFKICLYLIEAQSDSAIPGFH